MICVASVGALQDMGISGMGGLFDARRSGTCVRGVAMLAGLALLTACDDVGGGYAPQRPTLASNASLSVDAIRLQSQSEQLLSLAQEQKAATERYSTYAAQGAGIGAVLGGLGGALTGCLATYRNGRCDEGTTLAGAGVGAAGGAVIGYGQGQNIADEQSNAAAAENAMRRRLQVASQQLSTAQSARQRAEAIAYQTEGKLAALKREVLAGRATKAQLAAARTDAKADAEQVRYAAAATKSSSGAIDASGSGAQQLGNAQNAMRNEATLIDQQYNDMMRAIGDSAI